MDAHALTEDFIELHGDRLLGFAMLVTLGDATLASRLAAEALASGVERMDQLRHPVRAAAWLRARVTRSARLPAWGHQRPNEAERRDELKALGVDPATFDGLSALDVRSRAAVVATSVEGFAAADVHEIIGSDDRVRRARRDYLQAYLAAAEARHTPPPGGDLAARFHAAAAPIFPGPDR